MRFLECNYYVHCHKYLQRTCKHCMSVLQCALLAWQCTEGATHKLKEENLNRLRDNLSQGKAVATKKVYFVALPTVEAHSGHKVGEQGGFAQRIHPELVHQMNEMVLQVITDSSEVKQALKFYVENHLSKQHMESTLLKQIVPSIQHLGTYRITYTSQKNSLNYQH